VASVIPTILTNLNNDVLNQLDLARALSHPGESGRARENVLAAFLRRLIPDTYSVSTGFVIDATGAISRQVDLVIHRNDYHPVFEIGEVKHFMVESVAVAIENKTRIAAKKTLAEALENIKSVKALDRTNRGKNYIVGSGNHLAPIDPENFDHQVLGIIVTEGSLSIDVFRDEMLAFLRNNDRRHWPNMYADLRHFCSVYLTADAPAKYTFRPAEAVYFGISDSTTDNYVAPLIELAFEIVNFLRIFPLIDWKPTDYILAAHGNTHVVKI
jgi:hypothetical protein